MSHLPVFIPPLIGMAIGAVLILCFSLLKLQGLRVGQIRSLGPSSEVAVEVTDYKDGYVLYHSAGSYSVESMEAWRFAQVYSHTVKEVR